MATLVEPLLGFVHQLRAAGLPVSMTEGLDATRALEHVTLADRAEFKTALAATMVKDANHRPVFDALFDVYFALTPFDPGAGAGDDNGDGADGEGGAPRPGDFPGAGGGGRGHADELLALLLSAHLDPEALRRLAAAAVSRYAGMEPGRPVGGTYYLYRTLRAFDLEGLAAQVAERLRPPGSGPDDPLAERLATEEAAERIARFRQEVEAEIRRRLVADRGPDAMARALRLKLPEDVDFMNASREEMAA
ncbi:MAG: vWA domain-containing protein, partial [Acidimicrobiia bacterium]